MNRNNSTQDKQSTTVLSTKVQQNIDENTIVEIIAGKINLLDGNKSIFYSFNGTATSIWRMCGKPVRVKDIIDQMVDKYETDPVEIETDVVNFVQRNLKNGLLKKCPLK